MFTGIVTIEKDAELVNSNDKSLVLKARVSYRTRTKFRDIDRKTNGPSTTSTQFVDTTIFINKDKDGGTRISATDLTKGVIVYVRDGDIGQDIVEVNGKKQWYTKLVANGVDVVGKRVGKEAPVAEDTSFNPATFTSPPAMVAAAVVDENDDFRF